MGRIGLLAMLAVIVLLYVPPITHWFQQRQMASNTRAQVSQLQQEHNRLQSRLTELSTPTGIGRAARTIGMVRSGERAYVILGAGSH